MAISAFVAEMTVSVLSKHAIGAVGRRSRGLVGAADGSHFASLNRLFEAMIDSGALS